MNTKNLMFSSANSINIGRLIPQVVYYFHAYMKLYKSHDIALGDPVNFVVPTGNFGNILAGYYAKEMGLPIHKLICASNENKVLYDFLKTGSYDRNRPFVTTISPSMDILISSNLERLLYTISGSNEAIVANLMDQLAAKGGYTIRDEMKSKMRDFYGGYASEKETSHAIKRVFERDGYLIDTHTAVACAVYRKYRDETEDPVKTVIVSTASPYKFTSDVMKALDEKYAEMDDFRLVQEMEKVSGIPIPEAIRDLEIKPRLHTTLCEKDEMMQELERILELCD